MKLGHRYRDHNRRAVLRINVDQIAYDLCVGVPYLNVYLQWVKTCLAAFDGEGEKALVSRGLLCDYTNFAEVRCEL